MSDPSYVPVATDPAPALAPRAERASVMLIATVGHRTGLATRHRVRDVSPGGIRIDNAHDLHPGEPVSVAVGAIPAITGHVKWARGGFAGLAFAEPIDPNEARRKPGPATTAAPGAEKTVAVPSAGWIGDLRNAYAR